MDIVLVHPEIPHNTGCAGRLCAALGLPLHLVRPLGFSLSDRYLKRAGLDYWPLIELIVHEDWTSFVDAMEKNTQRPVAERVRLFSARGGQSLFEAELVQDDLLVFGSESSGLPAELLEAHPNGRLYLPIRAGVRSLNLANTVAVAAYTALQRAGLPLPHNDGRYEPPDEPSQGPSASVRPG